MMWRVAIISMAVVGLSLPTTVLAQQCPPELEQAKSKISSIQTAGQSKDTQAPRSLAGYEGGSLDAPRGQDSQAPRGQDAQAPRSAPGAKVDDAQAPRTAAGAQMTNPQAKIAQASTLVVEAEQACKKGDM